MCSSELGDKLSLVLDKLLDSEAAPEERPRGRKPLMVNHVTGYNQGISDAVINRANDLYVAKGG